MTNCLPRSVAKQERLSPSVLSKRQFGIFRRGNFSSPPPHVRSSSIFDQFWHCKKTDVALLAFKCSWWESTETYYNMPGSLAPPAQWHMIIFDLRSSSAWSVCRLFAPRWLQRRRGEKRPFRWQFLSLSPPTLSSGKFELQPPNWPPLLCDFGFRDIGSGEGERRGRDFHAMTCPAWGKDATKWAVQQECVGRSVTGIAGTLKGSTRNVRPLVTVFFWQNRGPFKYGTHCIPFSIFQKKR